MIRTYVRKKPKHRFIDDAKERCRLCFEKCTESISIFTQDSQISALALRITICIGLELTKEECLSNIICKECFSEVERYYSFRKKCELTYQKLKSHLQAYNEKKLNIDSNNKIVVNNSKELENLKEENNECAPKHSHNVVRNIETNVVLNANVGAEDVNVLSPVNKSSTPEVHTEKIKTNAKFQSTEFSSFLSKMLVKLGVVTHENNSFDISEPSMSMIHLEMGDGSQMTLELMEEEDVGSPSAMDTDFAIPTEEHVGPIAPLLSNNHNHHPSPPMKLLSISPLTVKSSKDEDSLLHECGTCHKTFSSRGVLNRHARVHSGQRPFACRTCRRAFHTHSLRRRHELVHLEQRPFSCESCPKSFTQAQALEAHARSHVPPGARALTLFPCAHCDKLFMHRSGLTRHTRCWHEGCVQACEHCQRGFRDRSSYKRHQATCTRRPAAPDPAAPDPDPADTDPDPDPDPADTPPGDDSARSEVQCEGTHG